VSMRRFVVLPVLLVLLASLAAGGRRATANDGVTVLSSSTYVDAIHALHVVGEVRNDTGQSIQFVQIIATFTDADDAFLATGETFTRLDVLLPDMVSPFDLLLPSPPAGIAHSSLQTQWDPTSAAPLAGLTVLDGSRLTKDSIGYTHIAGQVRNDTGVAARFVEVIATFYSADGTVVDVAFTFTKLDTLQPGQTSPFELLARVPASMANYRLQVQGSTAP